jgi:hypothetical protein
MGIQEEPKSRFKRYKITVRRGLFNPPSELQKPPDHIRHDFVFFLQSGLAGTGFNFGASCESLTRRRSQAKSEIDSGRLGSKLSA